MSQSTIELLLSRRSVKPAAMAEPGPTPAELEQILTAVGYEVVSGELTEAALAMVDAREAAALVLDSHALTEPLVECINEVISARNQSTGIVIVGDASFKWAIDPVRVTKPFSLGDLTRAVRGAVTGG